MPPALIAEVAALKEPHPGRRGAAARASGGARGGARPASPTSSPTTCPTAPTRARTSSCGAGASRGRFDFAPREHDDLGAALGMDFARAAKLSGARFVTLFGALARLERALAAFMLDLQTREHGYTEVAVPYLVRDNVLFGTGQLPKFAEEQFRTTSGHWLIPTSEVALTNLVAEEILDADALPLALHRLDPLLPLRGRRRRQGHQGDDPPAPVQQGRAGQHHPRRAVRRRARAHDRLRRGGAAAPRAALPGDGAVQRRHGLPGAARPTTSRSGCRGRGATARSRAARTAATSRRAGCARAAAPRASARPSSCTR